MTNQPEQVGRDSVGTSDGPTAPPTSGTDRDITTTAKDVASTAKDQAATVAQDAKQQARNLANEAREQAITKSAEQRDKAVEGLRSLSDGLDRMASGRATDGMSPASDSTAHEVVRQVSQRTRSLSDYLEQREPGQLLDDVRRFARERPGLFLGLAAGAGVLAGRLTRSVAAGLEDDDGRAHTSTSDPRFRSPVVESGRSTMSVDPVVDLTDQPFAVQPGSVQR